MNKFGYRNIWYDARKRCVHLYTWNEQGERVEEIDTFKPYLYIETSGQGDAVSIYNTNLKKIVFPNQFDRRRYVRDCGITRLYFNHKPEQQYLLEKYLALNDQPEFAEQPMKIFFLDIEVTSPNEFPKADEVKFPIDLITVYDTIGQKYHSFGLKKLDNEIDNVEYHYCESEVKLLKSFLSFWTDDYPDVMTGWNSDGFDTPYIINRITKILGEDYAKQLSPVGSIYYKENIAQKYGKTVGKWVIHGLDCIDYKDIYETFSREKRESYSLDYISKVELHEGKLTYNATSLSKLSLHDWQTYVEYNIKDVELLKLLEEKLRFLKTMRVIAYKGFCNISDTLGKVTVVTGAITSQALKEGKVLSTFEHEDMGGYPGGYVQTIKPNLIEWIITFDANSLYPNAMISLNISPETKIGKITNTTEDSIEILLTNGAVRTLTKKQFLNFIYSKNIALSKSKVMFTQDKKGIVPSYLDGLYSERVAVKKEKTRIERSLSHCKEGSETYIKNQNKIEQLDLLQFTIKILLNSIYGVFANRHGPLYDIDCASSITMTGQAVIKKAGAIIDDYARVAYDIPNKSITHYGDTDSAHISVDPIVKARHIDPYTADGAISKEIYNIANDFNDVLNKKITAWAKSDLNSSDPRFFFKREAICSTGLYQSSKHYILHVKDKGEDDPLPCDKIKPVGVELVKSTVSEPVKEMMMRIVKSIMITRDKVKTTQVFRDVYNEFIQLPPEEIAFRSGVGTFKKYAPQAQGLKAAKHTPVAVRGAINFNFILDDLNISDKYDRLGSGERVKWVYCTSNNKYRINNLAFLDKIPDEMSDIDIDYEKMFNKILQPAIKRLFECAHWNLVDVQKEYTVDIMSLLS